MGLLSNLFYGILDLLPDNEEKKIYADDFIRSNPRKNWEDSMNDAYYCDSGNEWSPGDDD